MCAFVVTSMACVCAVVLSKATAVNEFVIHNVLFINTSDEKRKKLVVTLGRDVLHAIKNYQDRVRPQRKIYV